MFRLEIKIMRFKFYVQKLFHHIVPPDPEKTP